MKRFLVIAALAAGAACSRRETESHGPAVARKPVAVTTAAVGRTAVEAALECTGTVRARISTPIAAKVMGYAREVRAQAGDVVREGQPLVTLDARDQEASVRLAEAAREEVRGSLPEADNAITAAKSQLELAQLTFARMRDLLAKRSVTQQEFDEAAARLKGAQAAMAMAEARRQQLDAQLARAGEAVRSAGIQQGYTVVAAPFTGVILARSVEPGALILPGAPLFTLENAGSYEFEADVPESMLGAIRVGQAAEVVAGDRQAVGTVTRLAPFVDAFSRTGAVKIALPALPGLRSGGFGRARFRQPDREVLSIPANAVEEQGAVQSVFVIVEGAARLRLVSLGAVREGRVEVLSGLVEGEAVVAPVPVGLRDGTPVEVRR